MFLSLQEGMRRPREAPSPEIMAERFDIVNVQDKDEDEEEEDLCEMGFGN